MVRLVLSLILAILLLIFTSQNMHTVELQTVFGPPIELPLILAVLGAFVAGFVVATFQSIVRRSKGKDPLDD